MEVGTFKMGNPALICRWRLSRRALPLENRHLRALVARTVNGDKVSTAFVGWTKQHLEWTLADGSKENPDGVLMLVMDEDNRAAMSCGPYESLRATTANDLVQRALLARTEGMGTGVSPEDLWLVREDCLVWGTHPQLVGSGANTLIADLAKTLGMPVQYDEDLLDVATHEGIFADEVFLVSDEHGVVPASDRSGVRAAKFAQSYAKLLS